MTLVVARISENQIAMAGDTLLTEHSKPLSFKEGTIKICIIPGNICIGFSNSPELAKESFARFVEAYPEGAGFSETVSFFENSGKNTGNDYIIAFGKTSTIIKIVDGKRINSISKTAWIGDKRAYERFREIEARHRRRRDLGRAVSAVIFGDEPQGSPASDLYSAMRELVGDRAVPEVGGFVSVVSNRGPGFRFSMYSDMLFDWPSGRPETHDIDLNEKITLSSTDENVNYSVTQIPSLYMDANYVAFYLLRGKVMFLFYGADNGLARNCQVFTDLEPQNVYRKISEALGMDLKWLAMVMSIFNFPEAANNLDSSPSKKDGMRLGVFCHLNTCPEDTSKGGLLRVVPDL